MKEEFMRLPTPLKNQIFIRLGISATAFLLFFVILFSSWDFMLCFPCLLLAVFLLVNDVVLLYHCLSGNYVHLTGVCTEIQTTGFHKRIKVVRANIDGVLLEVHVKKKLRNAAIGDKIELYASEHTPIYEQDDLKIIYSYYALAIRKEV